MRFKNGASQQTYKLIILAMLLVLLGLVLPVVFRRQPGPVGGKLFAPDFENGVELYVEDGYSCYENSYGVFTETPHSLWRISDQSLKEELLKLCGQIEPYRQMEKSSDIMLGGSHLYVYLPRIYLVGERVCYSIEILNWENYAGEEWAYFPIREECFNEPVLHIYRIDLSLKPENEAAYSFARDYFGADSVNTEGGAGWYSVMPRQALNELLNLIDCIDAACAEEIGI